MSYTSGFRSRALLLRHFQDHGAEFGATDENHYEQLADDSLGKSIQGTTVLECVRPLDAARVRYDYISQEFGIVGTDRMVLTYFKPDPAFHGKATNRAYYLWECTRR